MRNQSTDRKKKARTGLGSRAPQERGKRTRELLLQSAIASLVESGVHGLRYSQIAKLAQVPQPLMDYHFPSIEVLLSEMIHHMLEKLKMRSLEAIHAHETKPRKAFEAYIRAPFNLGREDRGFLAVWTAFYHLATVNKRFGDLNRSIRAIGQERHTACVVAILHHENKSNYATRIKLVSDVATQIQGITTGYCFMASAETEGNFKGMADLAVKAAAQILEASFPDQA